MDIKELKPLFDYLDEFKREVYGRFESVEKRLDVLQTTVDKLARDVKDYRDEHVILYRKVELLENWAKEVSKKLNIPLPN